METLYQYSTERNREAKKGVPTRERISVSFRYKCPPPTGARGGRKFATSLIKRVMSSNTAPVRLPAMNEDDGMTLVEEVTTKFRTLHELFAPLFLDERNDSQQPRCARNKTIVTRLMNIRKQGRTQGASGGKSRPEARTSISPRVNPVGDSRGHQRPPALAWEHGLTFGRG